MTLRQELELLRRRWFELEAAIGKSNPFFFTLYQKWLKAKYWKWLRRQEDRPGPTAPGFTIEGSVKKCRYERDFESGRVIRVIEKVEFYSLSVVEDPPNPDCRFDLKEEQKMITKERIDENLAAQLPAIRQRNPESYPRPSKIPEDGL